MTFQRVLWAIDEAAAEAARAAVDAFGKDVPSAEVAWDFLNELGLLRSLPGAVETLPGPAGSVVKRWHVPQDAEHAAAKVFATELGQSETYDLLYVDDRLIGVFPRSSRSRRLDGERLGYFNFSPYYFTPPDPANPRAVREWEAKLTPILSDELRQRRRHRPLAPSWYVDETYVKVKGRWCYLYRAIDRNDDCPEPRGGTADVTHDPKPSDLPSSCSGGGRRVLALCGHVPARSDAREQPRGRRVPQEAAS